MELHLWVHNLCSGSRSLGAQSLTRLHGVIGSASDSKSEGWGFDSLWGQFWLLPFEFFDFEKQKVHSRRDLNPQSSDS